MNNSNEEKSEQYNNNNTNTILLITALCLLLTAIVLFVVLYIKLNELNKMSDMLEELINKETIRQEEITTEELTTEKIMTEELTTEKTTTEGLTTEKATTEELTTEKTTTEKATTEKTTTEKATTEKTTTEKTTTEKTTTEETTTEEQTTEKVTIDNADKEDVISPLYVKGTNIVDKNGKVVVLNGISTHGLSWYPQYVNSESFAQIHDEWGANVVRLSMYTAEYNGYCTGGNKEELKQLIHKGVELATNEGMYVVIDWHILNDSNPNQYKSEAISFFDEMSKKYSSYTNVIYEICNEPNGGCTWSNDVKPYAIDVIKTIRANDEDAIIIVGTTNWSQDVDIAANDPITGFDNIVYALHFYAATHKEWLINKVETAISKGLPMIVSEFSICEASGSGNLDISSANKWMEMLNKYKVGFIGWNLSNKNETSAIVLNWCNKVSDFEEWELSESGKWLINQLKSH